MITDELLFRFASGETSPRESRRIESWLQDDPGHLARLEQIRGFLTQPEAEREYPAAVTAWASISEKMSHHPHPSRRKVLVTTRFARIAAALILIAGSAALWLTLSDTHTLRNREDITRSVFLPDGTQVDLGPGTKLVYGSEFLQGNRIVRLTGEAYFDVTSDPEHPFTVEAGMAKIKVTGTRFAVIAPSGNNEIEVTVRSGKVLFYNSETLDRNSFRMGLLAGEKGIFDPVTNRMDKTRDPYFQTTP